MTADLSNPYALMVNGDWGCGKTYHILNHLKPLIEKETSKKCIYISLNGVNSTTQINELITLERIGLSISGDDKYGKLKRSILQAGTTGAKILGRYFKVEGKDFKGFELNDFIEMQDCFYIFDDLERISPNLPVSEVLGYINSNYIEHQKHKTIIIANESEIKDKNYSREKEKVIGRTIEFKKDISSFIFAFKKNLSEKDPNSQFSRLIRLSHIYIIQRIEQSGERNLRSILFALDSLGELSIHLDWEVLEKHYKTLVLAVISIAFEFKKGRFQTFSKLNEIPEFVTSDYIEMIIPVDKTKDSWKKVREKFNSSNKEKTEEEKEKMHALTIDFAEKYRKDAEEDYHFLPSIYEYINDGYLDIQSLKDELYKIESEGIPQHLIVLQKLNNFSDLMDDDFIRHVKMVKDYSEEGCYNLIEFCDVSNNLFAFDEIYNLLPANFFEGIKIKDWVMENLPNNTFSESRLPFNLDFMKFERKNYALFNKYPKIQSAFLSAQKLIYEKEKIRRIENIVEKLQSPFFQIQDENLVDLLGSFVIKSSKTSTLMSSIFDHNLVEISKALRTTFVEWQMHNTGCNSTDFPLEFWKGLEILIKNVENRLKKLNISDTPITFYHVNSLLNQMTEVYTHFEKDKKIEC